MFLQSDWQKSDSSPFVKGVEKQAFSDTVGGIKWQDNLLMPINIFNVKSFAKPWNFTSRNSPYRDAYTSAPSCALPHRF